MMLSPSRTEDLMRTIALLICLFGCVISIAQNSRKDVPPAPLPEAIVGAKKVFLANGGSDLAFDRFYADVKDWKRWELVGSPEGADLIIELAYRVDNSGTRVWSASNASTGTTQVFSAQMLDRQLILTIYDGKSKTSLWATVDHPRLARREKNREKEMINSADRLVDQLKSRLQPAGNGLK
jgi:hypothetical protein